MSRMYEPEERCLLRAGEVELLRRFDAEGQVEAAQTMRKLGGLRWGHREEVRERGIDWRVEYHQACDAIERMLPVAEGARAFGRSAAGRMREEIAKRKRARYEMHRAQHQAELLEEENARLREERDDALSRAADGFAMGRRSAA